MLVDILAAVTAYFTDVKTPEPAGAYVNLLDLEWWQTLLAIGVALGLSPAPWLTMVYQGKLIFRSDMEARLSERDRVHDEAQAARSLAYENQMRAELEKQQAILDERELRYSELKRASDANAAAAELERRRADSLTEAAMDMVDVVRASNHFIESVGQVAREAQDNA